MSCAECWLSFNDKNEKKIIVKFHCLNQKVVHCNFYDGST